MNARLLTLASLSVLAAGLALGSAAPIASAEGPSRFDNPFPSEG